MLTQRRNAAALFVALLTTSALVACGSATAKTAQPAKATGPAVDVWDIVPIGAPNQTAPQLPAGAEAAFKYINHHGGIGSEHQLVNLKVCNTQGTPNGEVQCAQQAASDPKAIASVGDIIVVSTSAATAAFTKAGLPSIDPFIQTPSDFVAKINFPLFAPNFTAPGCSVLAARAAHAKTEGIASLSLPISIDEAAGGAAAAKKAGFTVGGQVQVPLTTTNVSPYVQQLQQSHPDFSVLLFDPELTSAWLAAAAQIGASGPVCMQDGLVSYQVLAGLGSSASNVYAASFLPDPAWKGYPLLQQFRSQAAAEVAAGNKSASLSPGNDPLLVEEGWVASQVVPQAAASIKGAVTRAKFLKAINAAKVSFGSGSGELLPPMNFAKPNPIKQYSRLFNTSLFLKKWDVNTKSWVRVPGSNISNAAKLVP